MRKEEEDEPKEKRVWANGKTTLRNGKHWTESINPTTHNRNKCIEYALPKSWQSLMKRIYANEMVNILFSLTHIHICEMWSELIWNIYFPFIHFNIAVVFCQHSSGIFTFFCSVFFCFASFCVFKTVLPEFIECVSHAGTGDTNRYVYTVSHIAPESVYRMHWQGKREKNFPSKHMQIKKMRKYLGNMKATTKHQMHREGVKKEQMRKTF